MGALSTLHITREAAIAKLKELHGTCVHRSNEQVGDELDVLLEHTGFNFLVYDTVSDIPSDYRTMGDGTLEQLQAKEDR